MCVYVYIYICIHIYGACIRLLSIEYDLDCPLLQSNAIVLHAGGIRFITVSYLGLLLALDCLST